MFLELIAAYLEIFAAVLERMSLLEIEFQLAVELLAVESSAVESSGIELSDIESSVESSLMVAGWRLGVSGGAVKSPDGTQATVAS